MEIKASSASRLRSPSRTKLSSCQPLRVGQRAVIQRTSGKITYLSQADEEPRIHDDRVLHNQIIDELSLRFRSLQTHRSSDSRPSGPRRLLGDHDACQFARSCSYVDAAVGEGKHHPVFKLKRGVGGNGRRCEKNTSEEEGRNDPEECRFLYHGCRLPCKSGGLVTAPPSAG